MLLDVLTRQGCDEPMLQYYLLLHPCIIPDFLNNYEPLAHALLCLTPEVKEVEVACHLTGSDFSRASFSILV